MTAVNDEFAIVTGVIGLSLIRDKRPNFTRTPELWDFSYPQRFCVIAFPFVMEIFFGYPKFHSVTAILLELSLPSFCTLVHNSQYTFRQQWINCTNIIVKHMKSVGITYM